ncbi:MAG: HDOD domain-containing protein [Desulfobulbaceae bacterium]|nr:MAG: HDOD domain-containing protein [Desulfobulbaceae bacterium]
MNKQEILQAVLESDELPTLPTVASKLISLTSKEETTLTDIAELVSQDMSLSSKILKVSNSAFYSFPQQIGSIKQAVSVLGTNAVRSLVLSFSFLSMKGGRKPSKFNFEKFWERSLASAVASKIILEKVKGADTEEVFISGLLQNLGELIFARTFPDEYERVLEAITDDQHDPLGTEESIIGTDHCYIGFEVARSWGFPNVLLQPIIYHHDPSQYREGDKTILATIKAVYLSDLLINILFSNKPEDYHKQFRKEAKKLLGLSNQHIENILEEVHFKVVQAGEYFGLKIKDTKSIQEILQEANIKLSLLNLDYDQMNKQLVQAKIELENLTRELEEKNKFLDNLANVDGLTEVYNHRYFQSALENEIDRSIRQDSTIALIITDIDHFKSFNDNFGHQTGDFILKEFCKALQSELRKYDTLARYGGEEFAIILPSTNEEEAMSVSEKLRKKIEESVFNDGSESYRLTSSFGIAVTRPTVEDSFSNSVFVNRADEALYEAKKQGRNKSVVWQHKKKWYKF